MTKPYTVLSFGGGIQTTYMLFSEPERYDEVIFADTGGEWPETYAYIETIVKPFCQKRGLKFTTVTGDKKGITTLEEFCLNKKIIPSRRKRWCTDDYKKKPIKTYVKNSGIKAPIRMAIGFSWDEVERMNEGHKIHKEYEIFYPLLEKHITRQQCIDGIKALGFPLPRKSGCWFCPFQKSAMWKELYHVHKPLFARAIFLEESSKSFRKYTLTQKPLRKLAIALGEGSAKLDEWTELDSCETGYCMR